MKAYKTALLEREFPFLVGVAHELQLSLKEVNDIKICCADNALMERKGTESKYEWCEGGYHHYTIFFAVTEDGEVIKLETEGEYSSGSGDWNNWTADSIGGQLFEEGVTPQFIVECVQNDADAKRRGVVSRLWTIHKCSRFDLAAHHAQQIDMAAAQIKSEIAAACA